MLDGLRPRRSPELGDLDLVPEGRPSRERVEAKLFASAPSVGPKKGFSCLRRLFKGDREEPRWRKRREIRRGTSDELELSLESARPRWWSGASPLLAKPGEPSLLLFPMQLAKSILLSQLLPQLAIDRGLMHLASSLLPLQLLPSLLLSILLPPLLVGLLVMGDQTMSSDRGAILWVTEGRVAGQAWSAGMLAAAPCASLVGLLVGQLVMGDQTMSSSGVRYSGSLRDTWPAQPAVPACSPQSQAPLPYDCCPSSTDTEAAEMSFSSFLMLNLRLPMPTTSALILDWRFRSATSSCSSLASFLLSSSRLDRSLAEHRGCSTPAPVQDSHATVCQCSHEAVCHCPELQPPLESA